MDEDAEHMPDEPGPLAGPLGLSSLSPRAPSLASGGGLSQAALSDRDRGSDRHSDTRRDYSENLSVHSSYDGDEQYDAVY